MESTRRTFSFFGFSLIELMIVIVIIGVLAAIAIPNYTKYVRKSRTAEAEANINSIGQYQEQYYSENNRYASAGGNPSRVPHPTTDSGGVLPFDTTNSEWTELGAIFTNNTRVRFQYRAFAGQFTANSGDASFTGSYTYTGSFGLNSSTNGTNVCSSLNAGSAQYFGITQAPYANWFVITAVGNQVADTTCSLFGKVNDRPAVSSENVTE